MSEELKPCPFCGGKAVLLGGPQAQECHSVWCIDCSAKMYGGMNAAPLVEKWNTRHAPAARESGAQEAAFLDAMTYGQGFVLRSADGTETHIPAESVMQPVAQGGGVDAEKVMRRVESIIFDCDTSAGQQTGGYLSVSDLRAIRSLLASPAGQERYFDGSITEARLVDNRTAGKGCDADKVMALVEAARLLGHVQAKKGFGCYTEADSRTERAMHEAIDKHSRALLASPAGQGWQPIDTAPCDAAVAAIQFALEQGQDCLIFLSLWNEGHFDAIRREWPGAPEAIFIGADPLHSSANHGEEHF